jgi:hypothetical protein
MMFRRLFTLLALSTVALVPTFADPPTKGNAMKYWRIYSDEKGESHAKEEHMPFAPLFANGPLGSGIASTTGATFIRAPAGTLEDFHTVPRRWYLIGIQGSSEVTLTDGTKLKMNPGTVMLMEDTTGKGHAVQVRGNIDHVVLALPIAEK